MLYKTKKKLDSRVLHGDELLERAKKNMIIEHDYDDDLIMGFLVSAVNYAETKQKLPDGTYGNSEMSEITKQAVIMLTAYLYESRDGSTAGFFADSAFAGERSWVVVDKLLQMDKNWIL